jgi:hypothetical protein
LYNRRRPRTETACKDKNKVFMEISGRRLHEAGPYYPLGTAGTVPRAYEEMEGRKMKTKK